MMKELGNGAQGGKVQGIGQFCLKKRRVGGDAHCLQDCLRFPGGRQLRKQEAWLKPGEFGPGSKPAESVAVRPEVPGVSHGGLWSPESSGGRYLRSAGSTASARL